jgi:hypothetical protein
MKRSRKLLCAAIASVVAGNAHAVIPPFEVDGINTPITGGFEYDASNGGFTADWVFTSTHGDTKGDSITGSMSYRIFDHSGDMTDDTISVLLSVPVDYTNNYYGSEEALGGWDPGEHPFEKLRKSDKLVAALNLDTNSAGGTEAIEIDYLSDNSPWKAVVKKDDAGLIQSVASSLEYNLAMGCGDTTNSNLEGAGSCGEEQVVYEFSLAAADFTDFGFGSVLAGEVHASPNTVPSDPPVDAPEPSTFALFFAGLPGVLWATRRRKRTRKQ